MLPSCGEEREGRECSDGDGDSEDAEREGHQILPVRERCDGSGHEQRCEHRLNEEIHLRSREGEHARERLAEHGADGVIVERRVGREDRVDAQRRWELNEEMEQRANPHSPCRPLDAVRVAEDADADDLSNVVEDGSNRERPECPVRLQERRADARCTEEDGCDELDPHERRGQLDPLRVESRREDAREWRGEEERDERRERESTEHERHHIPGETLRFVRTSLACARVRRNEHGRHSANDEQLVDEVGDAIRREESIGLNAPTERAGEESIANDAEDA